MTPMIPGEMSQDDVLGPGSPGASAGPFIAACQ